MRHGDAEVVRIAGPGDADAALRLLDRLGAAVDAPVVDEAERARLERLADGRATAGHRAAVIRRNGLIKGYVGVRAGGRGTARGDLALDRDDPDPSELPAALDAAVELCRDAEPLRLELWLRRVDEELIDRALERGFVLERRLAVLGREPADPPAGPEVPHGITIRSSRPDDEQQIVAVLAAAYAGTPEAGWDLKAFRARQAFDWFDPEDLLVAVDRNGDIVGLHWTKRRGGAVGEVYNLAVAPGARGGGLGRALLAAGLDHLHRRGIDEVLLWVDSANEPAVELYTSHGFRVRWEDVAIGRDLA